MTSTVKSGDGKISPPSPNIIVRYHDKECVLSRKVLGATPKDFKFLFVVLTKSFQIVPLPTKEPVEFKHRPLGGSPFAKKRVYRYVSMKLYATFLHGPEADGVYREVQSWDLASLVSGIDKIIIRREGEEPLNGRIESADIVCRSPAEESCADTIGNFDPSPEGSKAE